MACKECGDTGVIETGNNDIPCECRNGDESLFNVCGFDIPISGRLLKRFPYDPREGVRDYRKRLTAMQKGSEVQMEEREPPNLDVAGSTLCKTFNGEFDSHPIFQVLFLGSSAARTSHP